MSKEICAPDELLAATRRFDAEPANAEMSVGCALTVGVWLVMRSLGQMDLVERAARGNAVANALCEVVQAAVDEDYWKFSGRQTAPTSFERH
jgi:hypothetical protein